MRLEYVKKKEFSKQPVSISNLNHKCFKNSCMDSKVNCQQFVQIKKIEVSVQSNYPTMFPR